VGVRGDRLARRRGRKGPVWFHHGAQALADALPHAELRVLDSQTHNVKAKARAPLLTEFFSGEATVDDYASPPGPARATLLGRSFSSRS